MDGYEIKFSFEYNSVDKQQFDNLFAKIGNCLNIQFDENYNAYSQTNNEIYLYNDVSNQTSTNINTVFHTIMSGVNLLIFFRKRGRHEWNTLKY